MNDQHGPDLQTLSLGEWGTNCYVLSQGDESIIVDPASEAERILAAVEGTTSKAILLTHAHYDHVQALEAVRQATGAPLGIHPADAAEFGTRRRLRSPRWRRVGPGR